MCRHWGKKSLAHQVCLVLLTMNVTLRGRIDRKEVVCGWRWLKVCLCPILFNTYLPCENIATAIVPTFLCVLIQAPTGEVCSASSHMEVVSKIILMYFAWMSAVPVNFCISLAYCTRRCFWMKLCPKALPCSLLGWVSGLCVTQGIAPASFTHAYRVQLLPVSPMLTALVG